MTRPSRQNHVVVDTVVVSLLLNPVPTDLAASYRRLIGDRVQVVSFATITELRYGALKGGWGELRRRRLERSLDDLAVIQSSDQLMIVCADLRDRCQRQGHALGQKIHEADRWIASTALALDLELASHDHVFMEIDGLALVSTIE